MIQRRELGQCADPSGHQQLLMRSALIPQAEGTAASMATSDADISHGVTAPLSHLPSMGLSAFLLPLPRPLLASPDPHLVTAKVHQTPPIELHKTSLENVVSGEGRGQDQ